MQKSKLIEIAVAILCAICLWMYVVTVITPEDDILITDIPVVFQGENELRSEHELIISKKSSSTVQVKFHGTRADLKKLDRSKNGISAVLDVSQFTGERDYSAGYDIVLPSALQDNAVQVVDRSPKTIQFTVEKLQNKQIPVKGVFDGTLAEGYVQGELVFDQDTVKVTGPADLVERVNYAQVIVGGDNVSQSFTRAVSITLISTDGETLRSNDLTISTQEIEVTIPVLMEKTLPVTVTPIYAAGATETNTQISIFPSELTVRGPQEALQDLSEISLGDFDLAMVTDDAPVPVEILLPESVEAVSDEELAEVTVAFTGLERLDLTVTKMRPVNLAEDLSAKIMDKSVMVVLRGPSEQLIDLDDSALTILVDLGEYTEAGSFTVPVTVETGSEFVGAIGQYTVTVELTKHATGE